MQRLRLVTLALTLSMPLLVQAHSLRLQERVLPTGVSDRGELFYSQGKFSYRSWNSAQLPGKVRVILHIAGRISAKDKNAPLIEALKSARLPHARYQTTTIVNTDDAIPGSGMFVRGSIEESKKQHSWSQFIIDEDGRVRNSWQLARASSAVIVLDKNGYVHFVKDGALTQQEIQQVIALLTKLTG